MHPSLKPDLYINIHTHSRESSTLQFAITNLSPAEFTDVPPFVGGYSIGLHPWDISAQSINEKAMEIVDLAAKTELILAVGETGLDRHCKVPFDIQKKIFIQHLQIASKVGKPAIIHCVKAYSDLIDLRMRFPSPKRWIIHGFNENITIAQKLIDLGCFLSFGAQLLNPSSKAHSVFKNISGNYLLETDNAELLIEHVYQTAAQIKEMQIKRLKEKIFNNFSDCFY